MITDDNITWRKIGLGYLLTLLVSLAFAGCAVYDYEKRIKHLESFIIEDSVNVRRDTIDQGDEVLIIDTHIRRKKKR